METQSTIQQNVQIKKHKYFVTIKLSDGEIIKLGKRETEYLVNIYEFIQEYNTEPFMYDNSPYINGGIVSNVYLDIYVARIFNLIDKGLIMRRWIRKENGYYSYQLMLTPLGYTVAKALLSQS
jgi:hypothetical protein